MTHDILLNIHNIHQLKGFLGYGLWIDSINKASHDEAAVFHAPRLFYSPFCQTGASHVTPTVSFVEYALVIKAHGLLSCFLPFYLLFNNFIII